MTKRAEGWTKSDDQPQEPDLKRGQPVAGRELDALIAERVFGQSVIAWICCVHVEGEWSVHPDSHPEGLACYAERGPVTAARCNGQHAPLHLSIRPDTSLEDAATIRELNQDSERENASDVAAFCGHTRYCLEVVPNYSTDIAAAWLVVAKLCPTANISEPWFKMYTTGGAWRANFHYHTDDSLGDTAPLAICRAALLAVAARSSVRPLPAMRGQP